MIPKRSSKDSKGSAHSKVQPYRGASLKAFLKSVAYNRGYDVLDKFGAIFQVSLAFAVIVLGEGK